MYNPPALNAAETNAGYTDKQLFEYIQLLNISGRTLNLDGLAFTTGISYGFAAGAAHAPGERLLVVKSAAAFAARYGSVGRVAGEYTGNLDNAGEQIVLSYLGQTVQDFTYSDGSHPVAGQTTDPWPTAADGNGSSLVLINPALAPNESLATNWRPSIRPAGSPGRADPINYAEWARRYAGLSGGGNDTDGDGWSDQAEYFFGSSPVAVNSMPKTAAVIGTISGGDGSRYLLFTCTRSGESGDVNYYVEFSTDLMGWSVNGALVSSTTNPDGSVTEQWRSGQPITAGAPQMYARIRAQLK